MHTNFCKNCEHVFQGNFCSNCGQKTNTKRLDIYYIYDELKYTFLHINNGLLFTSKQLFIRPGDMVREFIEGKRVRHYKPILMVFVLAGITGLLMHYSGELDIFEKINASNSSNRVLNTNKYVALVLTKYYTLIELLSIPIVSVCTWFAFRRWKYNYIENIIINSFAVAQSLVFGIITFPIKYLFKGNSLYVFVNFILTALSFVLIIWLYFKLYRDRNLGDIIIKLIFCIFLLSFIFLITCLISIVLGYKLGYLS